MGEPKLGSTVPRLIPGRFAECKRSHCPLHDHGRSISLRVCGFPFAAGGALCRRSRVGAAAAAEKTRPVGRERPPFGCPLLRPTPGPQGVAHAHMHVTIIRRDGAMPVTPANAARVERDAHVVRVKYARASVRFFRETAFM